MKNQLVQLANELGFIPENSLIGWKEDYYLWLCSLQKQLREVHKIHIEIELTDSTTQYCYEYAIVNSNEREFCDEDFTDSAKRIYNWKLKFNTYEEALEKGLYEALKLIK